MRGNIDCPSLLAQIPLFAPKLGLREHRVFYHQIIRTNVGKNSCINRMCSLFNTHASNCDVHFDNINKIIFHFKSNLLHLRSVY